MIIGLSLYEKIEIYSGFSLFHPMTDVSLSDIFTMDKIWVSLDPVNGKIDIYPHDICKKISKAKADGKSCIFLDKEFFNATVHFRENNQHTQTTPEVRSGAYTKPSGYRHVRCIPFSEKIVLFLDVHGNLTEDPAKMIREITTEVSPDYFGIMKTIKPYWQWCTLTIDTSKKPIFNLPGEYWKFYSPENNKIINDAFGANKQTCEIEVCLTKYTVKFIDPIYAKQIDPIDHKVRLVRCMQLSDDEYDKLRQTSKPNFNLDDTCAICLDAFASTLHIPTITTTCNHTFHGICIQKIADQGSPCPYCKQIVDWKMVLAKCGGSVKSARFSHHEY